MMAKPIGALELHYQTIRAILHVLFRKLQNHSFMIKYY